MSLRFLMPMCALLAFAVTAYADGTERLGGADVDTDVSLRLTVASLGSAVVAQDPRVTQTRNWLAQATQATGESDEAVAAACARLSHYLFDVTKVRVSPLEVLEALAKHAPAGHPLNETTQRYFDMRAKKKLSHDEALVAISGR